MINKKIKLEWWIEGWNENSHKTAEVYDHPDSIENFALCAVERHHNRQVEFPAVTRVFILDESRQMFTIDVTWEARHDYNAEVIGIRCI